MMIEGTVNNGGVDRRRFLTATVGACAAGTPPGFVSIQFAASGGGSLTKEQRDGMTPSHVIDELKKGNERFRTAKMAPRDYLAEKRSSAAGQYPAAVILGCLDSRVAGNVVNDDMLGSMEFGCAVSGAKVVLVLGHTACGAVKGAIDDVVLGNLTGLLARIKPAIPATKSTARNQARTRVTLMLLRERMSCWVSPRFGDAVQSWRNWKGKEASRSPVRCTIWQLESWSSSGNYRFRLRNGFFEGQEKRWTVAF